MGSPYSCGVGSVGFVHFDWGVRIVGWQGLLAFGRGGDACSWSDGLCVAVCLLVFAASYVG